MRPTARRAKAKAPVVAALAVLAAAPAVSDEGPARAVQEPHYGEVLFHFFQQDYLGATTRLLAAESQDRLLRHREDAELLEGGLKLAYGLPEEAAAIFRRLLAEPRPERMRNRAWFHLAKLAYRRGRPGEAREALDRIAGDLPPELDAQRRLLLALVALESRDADAAVQALDRWRGPADWEAYARYNLGVALVRAGRFEEGIAALLRLGDAKARSEEMARLRDKANLAAGYSLLQAGRAERAREPLGRVRLEGPFASKAILGFGWAEAERGDYGQALSPWTTLAERDAADPAVQEALLAVPYAFGRLDALGRSARLYEAAIERYGEQLELLGAGIAAVRRGELIEQLLAGTSAEGHGGATLEEGLAVGPGTAQLAALLAGHPFQQALRGYRDLRAIADGLDEWAAATLAFDDMLESRRRRYEQRLPAVQQRLASVDPVALRGRRDALAAELEQVTAANAVKALMTPDERDARRRLASIGERLDALGAHPAAERLADKHRLLRGVLLWRASAAFPARRWETAKALAQLDAALEENRARIRGLGRAHQAALAGFEGYAARIAGLRRRIEALRPAVAQAIAAQRGHLERLAEAELERRRRRLDTYVVQARFALARIYDRAADVPEEAP